MCQGPGRKVRPLQGPPASTCWPLPHRPRQGSWQSSSHAREAFDCPISLALLNLHIMELSVFKKIILILRKTDYCKSSYLLSLIPVTDHEGGLTVNHWVCLTAVIYGDVL